MVQAAQTVPTSIELGVQAKHRIHQLAEVRHRSAHSTSSKQLPSILSAKSARSNFGVKWKMYGKNLRVRVHMRPVRKYFPGWKVGLVMRRSRFLSVIVDTFFVSCGLVLKSRFFNHGFMRNDT